VESVLTENKLIGLSWSVIDYDDVNARDRVGFWNLSHKQTMFGDASDLVGFRLMPLEPQFQKGIQAKWSYKVADMDRRLVAFKDESEGKVTSWKWDFGDGSASTEQNPVHQYKAGRDYTTILEVEGPAGKSRLAGISAAAPPLDRGTNVRLVQSLASAKQRLRVSHRNKRNGHSSRDDSHNDTPPGAREAEGKANSQTGSNEDFFDTL